jgi:DNA (cytosine-5)-methyltransferase 1
MGLEPGWVTDPGLGLTPVQQLTALGNGVVPQQATTALRILTGPWPDPGPLPLQVAGRFSHQ